MHEPTRSFAKNIFLQSKDYYLKIIIYIIATKDKYYDRYFIKFRLYKNAIILY
ncbi:hypothetical protein NUSPORA_01688 [Nucleospora cyclopteri]